jgi:hypothetical protein
MTVTVCRLKFWICIFNHEHRFLISLRNLIQPVTGAHSFFKFFYEGEVKPD